LPGPTGEAKKDSEQRPDGSIAPVQEKSAEAKFELQGQDVGEDSLSESEEFEEGDHSYMSHPNE